MLTAGLEVDGHVAVVVVGVAVVVEIGRQADVNAAQRIDHVAEGDEVDGDVAVERQPGDLLHLVLGRVSAAIATCVLRREAADDVHVRSLVRGVDLVDPYAVGGVLQVHLHNQVARDGHHRDAADCRVDRHRHDGVGQLRRVVLVPAATKQKNVYRLTVLELVGDGPLLRLHRLYDLADRVEVPPCGGCQEVVDSLVGEGGRDDDDQENERGNDRRDRPGQAVGDVVAGSPGPWPGPLHRHGDSTLQVIRSGLARQVAASAAGAKESTSTRGSASVDA